MDLTSELKKKCLVRFDELIAQGEALQQKMRMIPGECRESTFLGRQGSLRKLPDQYELDPQPFMAWRTSCASLLDQIVPPNSVHRDAVGGFRDIRISPEHFHWGLGNLKALRADYEQGFLGDLARQVEATLAADYMGQAERLLTEGQSGKFDHVPAAVLAGAVLEKALRGMCERRNPPISTVKDNGEPKALSAMIDDLKKAGAFNEMKAKQLRAWADMRNHAAHGRFEEFSRADVEPMLKGIENFLSEFST